MSMRRLFTALGCLGLLLVGIGAVSTNASAQACGPWNNWCRPQCGAWNNWCRAVCGPWNGWCAPSYAGPGYYPDYYDTAPTPLYDDPDFGYDSTVPTPRYYGVPDDPSWGQPDFDGRPKKGHRKRGNHGGGWDDWKSGGKPKGKPKEVNKMPPAGLSMPGLTRAALPRRSL
jgi:hypothetical protein